MIPGEYFLSEDPIIANIGKSVIILDVKNTGDRPIQVGSHAHFFEINKALEFSRKKSYGFHLNIPAGTSIRFEPGDSKKIELTEFSGKKTVYGFSGLVNGSLSEKQNEAFSKAKEQGFRGMEL
ncbi:urease subunit beta [Nitrosopumilus sp.]|jgi:urease subunit beta|nr:urease subunit beta [Nitrosopumilus sp.]MCH1519653.1 urease subunit beta [Nitrosopumilus sp.]MCH1549341.1 urease subunit beta [Nitrosopumilus sp.]MDB4840808.1 urease subunit beta [Nitrosopumilus sp.]MDC0155330.1 urease subunit beta [Nitrosopumilus sp.]MDC0209317.1 urease subunit beta [Nitrosopumilus sp.]|tara:strand:- start:1751 stop:2119 length:369 start_codon:yes stop_codon:yes gene_type:complete